MVIKKKETKEVAPAARIEEIINRGGSTTQAAEAKGISSEAEVRFTLRIPAELITKLDKERGSRVGKVSRNQWILEAISRAIQ